MNESQTFALILWLVGIGAGVVVVSLLAEVALLSHSVRKLSRGVEEDVPRRQHSLTAISRIRDPFMFAVIGGIAIGSVAFGPRVEELFASYPWAVPVVLLSLVGASLLLRSLRGAAFQSQAHGRRASGHTTKQGGNHRHRRNHTRGKDDS